MRASVRAVVRCVRSCVRACVRACVCVLAQLQHIVHVLTRLLLLCKSPATVMTYGCCLKGWPNLNLAASIQYLDSACLF